MSQGFLRPRLVLLGKFVTKRKSRKISIVPEAIRVVQSL